MNPDLLPDAIGVFLAKAFGACLGPPRPGGMITLKKSVPQEPARVIWPTGAAPARAGPMRNAHTRPIAGDPLAVTQHHL